MSYSKLPTFRHARVAFFLMITVWFVLGQGCAYYNTFYNTKKHFTAGERARSRAAEGQNVNTQDYKKCIETGSKLLELYPNSRWIDDCLLLMGKSYYWSKEYPRAQRKFEELVTNFPGSKHVSEARLWLAETLVSMERGQEALAILDQLLATPKAKAFFAQGSFLAGDVHFDAERYTDAADAYREAAQKYRDRNRRAESFYMLGRSLFMRKEYEEAKIAFDQIARLNPPRDIAYMGLVESGRCMAELGDTQGALALLDRLRRDIRFQNFSSGIDLTLAKIAAGKDDYEEAIRVYKQYIDENPNGEGKGEAFFRLGMIYRNHRRNLSAAAAYFDSSSSAGSSALADSAAVEAKILNRGLGYIRDMNDFKTWIHYADSLLQIYPPPKEETLLELAPEPTDSIGEESPPIPEDTLSGLSIVSLEDSILTDSSAAEEQLSQRPSIVSLEDSSRKDTLSIVEEGLLSKLPVDSMLADSSAAEEQLSERPSIVSFEDSSRKDTLSILEEGLLSELPVDSMGADSMGLREELPVDSTIPESDSVSQTSPKPGLDFTLEEFWETQSDLQKILFCIGEFYWYDLNDIDTAFIFFERAERDTFDKETQWHSNLVLAELSKQRGADDAAIRPYYEAIMDLDGIPIEVENRARVVLGLPQKPLPRDTLRERFLQLEEGVHDTTTSPDSLIAIIDSLMTADTLSIYFPKLLFTKAFLYEHRLENLDSTKATYRELISIYPDSMFSMILMQRLDTNQLAQAVTDADSLGGFAGENGEFEDGGESGWPPPEESLLGRRGH